VYLAPDPDRLKNLIISKDDIGKTILFCPECFWQASNVGMKPYCPECRGYLHLTCVDSELVELCNRRSQNESKSS
jgi:acid phosphatase class B